MSDLIYRQDALEAMSRISDCICEAEAADALCELPEVDAVPTKRGEWRKTYLDHEAIGERPSIFYCSACCACSSVKTNYCPQCGARMDEE